MSFSLQFEPSRKKVKTKVVDLADTDGHPTYLLSPGVEDDESAALRKWERLADWVVKRAIAKNAAQVMGMIPASAIPTPEPAAPRRWAGLVVLIALSALVGLIAGVSI